MSAPPSRGPLHRLAGATLAIAILTMVVAPAAVAAASVSLGTPSAKSTFGTGIVFTQPYSGSGIQSAEIAITYPGDIGPSVVPVDSVGSGTLTYTLDTSGGGVPPFQPMTAQFSVVLADGTSLSGSTFSVTYADDRFQWQSVTGALVTIHWFQGTTAFAQQLLDYGEQGIAKAASFFGVTETKPVDFYIYPSQSAFAAGLSVPETIGGEAETTYRTCFALVAPTDLAYGRTVVPHELTHIIFADLTDNPYHSPPRWVNEGLAVYLSEGYGSDNRSLVSQAVSDGTLVPLAALAGYFALDQTRIYLSYAESVSAIDFMVRKYGQAGVRKLLDAYAAGSSDDEAFTAAFGIDMAAFDKAWQADNGVTAAPTYGPQPAPTGPLPPGWSGSTATTPPVSTTTPASTPSRAGGGPAGGSSTSSDATDLLVAGLIALGGLVLLGTWVLLYFRSNGSPAA
jgi:hypothetical protein